MKQFSAVIQNPTGLHARPAKLFVNTAKQFKSTVRVQHGEKNANAKSMISMLTLGAGRGAEITVSVDGEDEEEAAEALNALIESGLGESELMERVQAEEVAKPPAQDAPLPVSSDEVMDGIKGVAASPGIVIGPVFQFSRSELTVEDTFSSTAEEQARLQEAIATAQEQLTTLREQMLSDDMGDEAAIFDVHLEILEDPELVEGVAAKIEDGQGAARAWRTNIDERSAVMAELDDPTLAARSADILDVGARVLRVMLGVEEEGIRLPDHPVIIVADDLAPSETASLDKDKVLGFCTAAGGPTAHTAIIARALSLPAVVSAGETVLDLANGTTLILNGETGIVTVDPAPELIAQAEKMKQQRQAQRAAALEAAAEPATTQDGHRVEVVGNVGGVVDAEKAMQVGTEGIGLLRTEFLFLGREEAPTEDQQFQIYRDIVQTMQGLPVIVRTLDIGGDKPVPYIDVPHEENPFLGERGIRLCLNRPEIFRQQISAILRAASFGPIRIMFPMVADISEWRQARALVLEMQDYLQAPRVELGIMIEVPSAALMADAFAPEVDFFSIGTNDLTQYTLAMDRMHPLLATKADGLHPAVLRLIAKTVDAAHQAGKWVGVCGELGSDPQAAPILVGLGVDELSVNTAAIPLVKAQVRSLNYEESKSLGQQALQCATAAEVRALASS